MSLLVGENFSRALLLVPREARSRRGALQALIDDTLRRRHGIYWSSYDARDGDRIGRTPPRALPLPLPQLTAATPEAPNHTAAA